MKLLLSWVRDFVDVTVPAESLAETLALRGFEVAAVETLGSNDAVIDFEVTANRPDCLSVLGFAREIGTVYGLPVRLPSMSPGSRVSLAATPTGDTDRLTITVDDAELCPRYTSAVAEVTSTTTPAWLASRLQAVGVRSISPFVDITNYVLMELGQPLHAFDLDTLSGKHLRIRRAINGETLTTLDGMERKLDADMLVIADGSRAQAVAGVMGGAASEVSASTRLVAFESAYFKPASVRRTSRRLGLKTEASSRFERGADINASALALQRALALMHEVGAGKAISPIVDRYPLQHRPITITLRRKALTRLLGLDIPNADVVRILTALGLTAAPGAEGWAVTVPTFRVDLLREVDLIEEVGRHWGFDKLDAAFPVMTSSAAAPDPRVSRDHLVRRVLTGAGVSEAVTFGFIESNSAAAYVSADAVATIVPVANPLSAKFDVLRPSLLPGLVDVVARNRRHGRRDVAVFEIGARFTTTDGETRGVAVALTGAAQPEHWSGGAHEVDAFDAKGLVEALGDALLLTVRLEADNTLPYLVPGQSARVLHADQLLGVVGVLAPALADRAGAPRQDRIVVAELNLDRISQQPVTTKDSVRPLARYPFVVRDLSIVVADALPASTIHDTILEAGRDQTVPLTAIMFFDRYQGKGVPDGSVSVSVRLTFQSADRTLTDSEVQHAFDHILSALVRKHSAVQR